MNHHFISTIFSVSISYVIFVSFNQSIAHFEHDFEEAKIDTEESLGKRTI